MFNFQANAIGRSAKTVREFLEKHYNEETARSDHETIKLALKSLMEVVQSGGKNMELAVMKRNETLKVYAVFVQLVKNCIANVSYFHVTSINFHILSVSVMIDSFDLDFLITLNDSRY